MKLSICIRVRKISEIESEIHIEDNKINFLSAYNLEKASWGRTAQDFHVQKILIPLKSKSKLPASKIIGKIHTSPRPTLKLKHLQTIV